MANHRRLFAADSPSSALPQLPSPSPTNNDNVLRDILQGLIIGISAVFVVALFYYFCRKILFPILNQRFWKKGSLKNENMMLRQFRMEELEKATNNFSQDCLLVSGAFGNVYKGTFEIEGTLAIKRPHADSYHSREEFRNEVRLLSKVKHRNLVGLVGFCEEPGARGKKILVNEYAPNGSLLEYITGRRESLTWRQRVNIAIGAAKGITHLHEGIKPSIIHRDIKPSNILIGDGFEAKVSDFGLVRSGRSGDQSHVSSQIKGTPGYLDPAYCSSFHLTPFSNVYSFGIISLQLVAARPAVYIGRNQSNYNIIEWARPSLEQGSIGDILDVNLLAEPCNMEMMLQMGRIGLRCVVKEPKHRRPMRLVWKEIEEALEPLSKHARRSSSATAGHHSNGSISSRSIERAGQVGSMDLDYSQSFVSINGAGFQKFHVEMDSLSLESTSLRCFEDSSTVSLSGKQNSPFLLSTNYPHSSITHVPEKSSYQNSALHSLLVVISMINLKLYILNTMINIYFNGAIGCFPSENRPRIHPPGENTNQL